MNKPTLYGIYLELWIVILRINSVYNEMNMSVYIIFTSTTYNTCHRIL